MGYLSGEFRGGGAAMSIMFRNSNATLERELAAEDYKAHPVRNRIAILAVALTAILIVVTFRWESDL